MQFLLEHRHRIKGCESLQPYSEFLGVHSASANLETTSIAQAQELSNFVPDPLMLRFFIETPTGHGLLTDFLTSCGMELSEDNRVTFTDNR